MNTECFPSTTFGKISKPEAKLAAGKTVKVRCPQILGNLSAFANTDGG